MSKKDEAFVVPQSSAIVARPAYLDKFAGDKRGTEHITKDDLKMPRLSLAQKMSPQIEESDAKFIEGLKFGELFNDLTSQNYGTGPVLFTVVRADKPRGVEFFPLDDGGGVKDFNVPANDPRLSFGPDGEKPVATLFYDFVLALLPSRELIALSLKGTALKVARTLNGLMMVRGTPSFTGLYEMTTTTVKNDKGSYAVYRVKNAGWVDEESAAWAESIYDSIRDKQLIVERESTESGGDVSTEY
jgi:hypothetical protein